jgi:hypothetical protein
MAAPTRQSFESTAGYIFDPVVNDFNPQVGISSWLIYDSDFLRFTNTPSAAIVRHRGLCPDQTLENR